ncbi:hypothetical protein CTAYLR_009086 [Chrysophaeum taylorii]|uniref:IST1-like protein n=1 Tax=Chrysophaeum taylorii TaxID=2483200 RepID=A0AAD7UJQ9_9STRA|nr:hypothetical protein CTAYLR_009086 [Chrysophaeum taylorii]
MLKALGLERFNANKLKPHLKMSEQRFAILNAKKVNLIKVQKREIAELLRQGKEEKARIRVEHLIRLDFTIEAYELLGLLCELVHERAQLVIFEKECPPDMKEAMCTLIWASQRTEVPELREVARQLELKYGPEFTQEARTGENECVNTRVAHKLSIAPPSAKIVVNYLTAIAKEYDIEWAPADLGLDDDAMASQSMPGPSGFSVQVAPGSNLTQAYEAPVAEVVGVQPPTPPVAPLEIPSAPTTFPETKRDDDDDGGGGGGDSSPPDLPGAPGTGDAPGSDYDTLAKRFESLKK